MVCLAPSVTTAIITNNLSTSQPTIDSSTTIQTQQSEVPSSQMRRAAFTLRRSLKTIIQRMQSQKTCIWNTLSTIFRSIGSITKVVRVLLAATTTSHRETAVLEQLQTFNSRRRGQTYAQGMTVKYVDISRSCRRLLKLEALSIKIIIIKITVLQIPIQAVHLSTPIAA